ncbi:MAG TPA: Coq4 family protein [Caulobacteraceae bacterium]|jgi:ubiquinone biosynthesis protein COQ4
MSDIAALESPFRPLTALRAVGRLFRDPEDTRQVFVVMTALRGRSGRRLFERFLASPVGATITAERRRLLDRLQDRAGLAALPDGSLGQAYLAFMQAEQLSAEGLVEASEAGRGAIADQRAALFRDRMRDMHDLNHVLTGYGRDGLGELSLLAFMYRHTGNLGGAFIALMGLSRFPKGARRRAARAAVIEGFRDGGRAAWLPGLDWEALLARPLAEVRRELNVMEPVRYQAARLAQDAAAS